MKRKRYEGSNVLSFFCLDSIVILLRAAEDDMIFLVATISNDMMLCSHLLAMTRYFWLRSLCIASNTPKKIFVKVHLPFVHQRLCKVILQNQKWFWWSSCSETKVGSIFMALLFTAPEVKLTKTIFCQCAIISPVPSTAGWRLWSVRQVRRPDWFGWDLVCLQYIK